ncbi:MAG: low specificity L-threonine aldolase, partial [Clostridia bacterium]|nr:low specificity L-threonine aldolase [Clostridia bacterium]
MIRFDCDYTEGCTQAVLDALTKTNMEQSVGYGEDAHCENARNMIKAVCKTDGDVHFLVGG